MDTIRTERLILRSWREQDRAPFRALNEDPRVMAFLGGVLSAAQSDALVDRIEAHFRRYGFGLAAAEHTESGTFIGYIGLAACTIAPFESSIEIGWRLAAGFWNRGLATEGAQAIVHYAFETLGLSDLISFTAAINTRSRRVMEKLGMTHDRASDFDHPNLPDADPLRRHVLYRLDRRLASNGKKRGSQLMSLVFKVWTLSHVERPF